MTSEAETSSEPKDLSVGGQIAILLAASTYPTFAIWANNPLEFPHPMRLVLISGAIFVLTVLLTVVTRRLGAMRWAAASGGIVWALTLGLGGPIAARIGVPLTLLAGAVTGALIVVLMTRLRTNQAARYPIIVVSCILGFGPLGPLAGDLLAQTAGAELNVPDSPYTSALEERPDIFLIVVDGFIGLDGSREVFGESQPSWAQKLVTLGFDVPASGWASYPITIASVPSLFEMDYPIEADVPGSRAVISALIDKMGGSNRLVSTLNASGYHTTMMEAGWSWSHCGGEYDVCVPSAFLDEGTYRVLLRSIAGPDLMDRWPSAFTLGASHAMSWMLEELWLEGPDSQPRFFFGHVMAPHPPLYLTGDCQIANDAERAGVLLDNGRTDLQRRKELYLEQAECVTEFLVEFTSRADANDVLIFVADHGSDSTNQLIKPGTQWTEADTRERLSSMVAVRAGRHCDLGETVVLPNIVRAVLDCVALETPTPQVEVRMFSGGLRLGGETDTLEELTPSDVERIVGDGT